MTPFQAAAMPHEKEFSFDRTRRMATNVDMGAPRGVLPTPRAIDLASNIIECYRLASIEPLLASCRTLASRDQLSVAVVGRFKAGKSSFLNHFLGRELLPVGVTPVTTVVTEIVYGESEKAVVHFLDGRIEEIALANIRCFVAERENPENGKQVSTLEIELPQLAGMRALRFVDMPGLESALAHNTEATLSWLPNAGLALVAVSVDPPLSQHDVALLRRIYEYTPNVSILLTKVDLLSEAERVDVSDYVRDRLSHVFGSAPPIFPYSVRTGYENCRAAIEENLFQPALNNLHDQRRAVLNRKVETLLHECRDYLYLALHSAEKIESERAALESFVAEQRQMLDEIKYELRLIVQHARGGVRGEISKLLEAHRDEIEGRLLEKLDFVFPTWTKSLSFALESFQNWLTESLTSELALVSDAEREHLIAPLAKLKQQIFRSLQTFRDQLSERCVRAFGIPLRTTEAAMKLIEPRTPDIRIGRIFDRNWELLSPVAPISLLGRLVRRHFASRVPYMVEKNLSRLATQWDESLHAAMTMLLKEAEQRLEQFVATVEQLINTSNSDAPKLRADLDRLDRLVVRMRTD
jgi:GTP-binding protein EngB required for normal cell division